MKKTFRRLMACLFAACCAGMSHAQQVPPIPVDPNVRIGKLENGLTYYIRHNELPENRADFYIAQKVGSILEEDNQRGLAHFLEHMCFNGTTHFPGDALIHYLETIGVRFGENLNAYTSVDETVYNICNVPVTRDGIIDSCLLILHDWSNDLTLAPQEIDKERGVIHEEWRTRTGAMMRMYEKAFPAIYEGSRYAYRLPIGTMEVVDNFPYQALRDFYEKWYRPDQQGIIVVGDIDVDQIENKIKNLFADIEMPENPAERIYYPVPDNKEPIITLEKDKEQTSVLIYLYNKHEAVPNEAKTTVDYLIYNYTRGIISQMLDARLNEMRQKPNPPFIYAGTYDSNFYMAKTKDAFTGIATCPDNGIETALAALYREIERAHRFGFTASEYARAKAEYLRHLESAYKERDKQKNGAYVDEYVRHFIDNEPIPGIEQEYAIMNQIVPLIPVDAVNQTMGTLVSDSNLVVSIFCPDKEGMQYPSKDDIREIIDGIRNEEIEPYVDQTSDEPLVAEKPQPGRILSAKEGPFGTTVMELSNGAKAILKKTDFKADEILMNATSPGGTSLFPESEIINIKALNDVMAVGGLGNFSTIDLEKALAGKKANVKTSVGYSKESISGSCSPEDLETMMQLTYLSFTAPRMDQEAFQSYKNRTKASLQNIEAEPWVAFNDSAITALYNHHPRKIRLKADMIDQINYQKVMDMYKDRFKDASDFTFVFVGNIDADSIRPFIETYIASLPATHRKESMEANGMHMRKGNYRNVFTRQMETPTASIVAFCVGDMPYTPENITLMNVLSQVLDIVYTAEVREKEGGTYGVGVLGDLFKYPYEEACLQIVFDTDPRRYEQMQDIVLEEAQKIAANGPKAEDLEKVKEFMLKKHKENLKENGYWLNVLKEYYETGEDVNTHFEEFVANLTPAQVQQFAKDLMNQGNLTEIIMTVPE